MNLKRIMNYKRGSENSKIVKNDLNNKLEYSFYNVDCYSLATSLLGKILVRNINGHILKARIVETECYPGSTDKASHSYMGKRTPRNEPMFMSPGTSYVYITYGIYYCFNISSLEEGGAVLIRAAEPVMGYDIMHDHRMRKRKGKEKRLKPKEILNGPSKLCAALCIDKDTCNKLDLCTSKELWVEDDNNDLKYEIITSKRIGIESTGAESAEKLLRFYIYGNENVSKKDIKQEIVFKTINKIT